MKPEHLPGGRFWEPTVQDKTSSTMKHNKSPEFIFDQLDSLVSYRPNASVLANEAYLMCAYKKTSEWLKNLPDDEKEKATLREKKSFHEMETPWKPCGNYRLIVSIWFPMHGNNSVVST